MQNPSRRDLVKGAAATAVLGLLCSPPRASARIAYNTVDPVAALSDRGRRVVLTGPIQNSQAEWVDLRVTVTQRSTSAVAEGRARIVGGTTRRQWEVVAATQGSASFQPGPATVVAMAVSSLRGRATDAHQWLVEVVLGPE